jgi:integrase
MKRPKKRKYQKPEIVTIGNTHVKIYPHRRKIPGLKRPHVTWQVADKTTGERRLRGFADHAAAVREAERIARLESSGQAVAASMSDRQAASFGRAIQLIKPTGDELEIVAARYAEAVKILGGKGKGARIIEAAKALMERDGYPNKTVAKVVEEMLKAKQGKREERTLSDLKNRLAKFTEAFHVPIATIRHSEIQEWLDKMKTSERDRLNYRSKVNTLFNWAFKRGYVPVNPVAKTELPEAEGGKIEIYTPAELQRLIAAASERFLPCLAIGAFAGLRSSEIVRLKWEDVNLARGFITASAKKKGTPSYRRVPIQPNLAAWLANYAEKKGDVWTGTHDEFYSDARHECVEATRIVADDEKGIAAQEPVKWKHNGLRHSFISYRLAILEDDAKTALEAGNSRGAIHGHYKELVNADDAKAWFAIAPTTPSNVVPIAKAQKA